DLDGDDIGIRKRLDPKETAVLGPQDRGLEVFEVVELLELPGLVGVVEVPDEPVSRVPEDVPLNRADFLGGVDETQAILRPLLSRANPDVGGVQFGRGGKEVVGFLDVN